MVSVRARRGTTKLAGLGDASVFTVPPERNVLNASDQVMLYEAEA
jgi:hypothetical protein